MKAGEHAGESRIDAEAAEWLVRRDRGLSAAEQDEFLQWFAADPRHAQWFRRHQQSWQSLDLLADWRPEHATVPNPDLLAKPARRRAWVIPFSLAAAAAVVGLLALTLRREGASTAPVVVLPAAPAVASGYERRELEDGSVVELNRGAAIEVAYTEHERRVRLVQGEAHFRVAKNPARPFFTEAAGVSVRAVGTAFDVRVNRESVEVLVTEGHVQLRTPVSAQSRRAPHEPHLLAGQRAIVSLDPEAPAPTVVAVAAEQIERELRWQPRMLDFTSTPLRDVVAQFNRHNTVPLVIADEWLAGMPIVASFRSDNVEGFVRLLEVTAGVAAERRPDRIVLRAKP